MQWSLIQTFNSTVVWSLPVETSLSRGLHIGEHPPQYGLYDAKRSTPVSFQICIKRSVKIYALISD